jgi:hypothetical protein
MEAIGLAASLAGLVALAASVVQAGCSFYHPFKEFAREVESIKGEVVQLEALLCDLQPLVDTIAQNAMVTSSTPASSQSPKLGLHEIKACMETLQEVKKLYKKLLPQENRPVQAIAKRFLWPISRDEVQDIMERLERHKSTFTLALVAHGLESTVGCLF